MIAKAIQSSTTSTLPISSESMAGFSLAGPPLPVVVELSPVDLLLIGLPLLDSPLLDLTLLVEALQVIALMSSECSQLVTDLLLVGLSLVDLVLAAEERQATCLVSAQCLGLEYMEYHQTSLIVVSATVARYFQVMTWSYLRSYCSY